MDFNITCYRHTLFWWGILLIIGTSLKVMHPPYVTLGDWLQLLGFAGGLTCILLTVFTRKPSSAS